MSATTLRPMSQVEETKVFGIEDGLNGLSLDDSADDFVAGAAKPGRTPCYLISHAACLLHDVPDHPECPARLSSILERLKKERPGQKIHDAELVTRQQLLGFHTEEHITALEMQFEECEQALANGDGDTVIDLDDDTGVTPHTREAALRSCGSVCQAVDVVLGGIASKAFCAVRPPGHHAEPNEVSNRVRVRIRVRVRNEVSNVAPRA